MFRLLVLATLLSACLADELAQPSSPSPIPMHYYGLESQRLHQGLERLRHDMNTRGDPHSHLDDPYRTPDLGTNRGSMGYDHDNRRDEYHNQHDDYDSRRDNNDNRRDNYDNRRDNYDNFRDEWKKHGEGRWWTDKDQTHHLNDDYDIRPVILRTIKSHEEGKSRRVDITRQNKIVADVYSPDYAQPTWIIDYRYLKTGGRDYTRGPGGQIIILPKGISTNEHKDYKNYDELIDHLRQKYLAERSKPQYFMPLGQEINQRRQDEKRDDNRWYN